jgi:hypothetical protein
MHDGVRSMRIDPNGDLVLSTPGGEIRQRRPSVYQNTREIAARYRIMNAAMFDSRLRNTTPANRC